MTVSLEPNFLWKPLLPFCCLGFQEPRTHPGAVPSSTVSFSEGSSLSASNLQLPFLPACLLMYPDVHFFFIASKTKFSDVPSKFLLMFIFSDCLYFLNLKHYSIRITFAISNILVVSGNTFIDSLLRPTMFFMDILYMFSCSVSCVL